MVAPLRSLTPAEIAVSEAVGRLIEFWGFKRNMGRMWAVLYLEDHPLNAADLGFPDWLVEKAIETFFP